jgi:hypothetical protein
MTASGPMSHTVGVGENQRDASSSRPVATSKRAREKRYIAHEEQIVSGIASRMRSADAVSLRTKAECAFASTV